jgi:hypothetical protein
MAEIKQNPLKLSVVVDRHILRVMAYPAAEKLVILVSTNPEVTE